MNGLSKSSCVESRRSCRLATSGLFFRSRFSSFPLPSNTSSDSHRLVVLQWLSKQAARLRELASLGGSIVLLAHHPRKLSPISLKTAAIICLLLHSSVRWAFFLSSHPIVCITFSPHPDPPLYRKTPTIPSQLLRLHLVLSEHANFVLRRLWKINVLRREDGYFASQPLKSSSITSILSGPIKDVYYHRIRRQSLLHTSSTSFQLNFAPRPMHFRHSHSDFGSERNIRRNTIV